MLYIRQNLENQVGSNFINLKNFQLKFWWVKTKKQKKNGEENPHILGEKTIYLLFKLVCEQQMDESDLRNWKSIKLR